MKHYKDREKAGEILADKIERVGIENPIILALPRGGVPVAKEIAQRLHSRFDLLMVKKIGAPGNPEFAVGAVSEDAEPVLDYDTIRDHGFDLKVVKRTASERITEVQGQMRKFRGTAEAPVIEGRVVLLVDDGIATGASVKAAMQILRKRNPSRIIVVAPVGSKAAITELKKLGIEVICPLQPEPFFSVGSWYDDFGQVTDEEVVALLAQSKPSL